MRRATGASRGLCVSPTAPEHYARVFPRQGMTSLLAKSALGLLDREAP